MPLTELEQLNAIVGLSMKIEAWPSTLADVGYVLDRIELKFKVADPKRPGLSIHVNPDLLFVDDIRNFSLIAELKSGRFQDFVQLDRFVRITPLELIRYGGVPVKDQSQAVSHKISVAEVINYEFMDEYRNEFVRVNHSASLISISFAEIKSQHGTLADSKLDRVLKNGVSLRGCHRPTKLIRVLPSSNDEYALISSAVDAIKQLWLRNSRKITPTIIGRTVFKQLWDRFDREAQARYMTIVKEVLNDLVQTELHSYLRPAPNDTERWSLRLLPESIPDRQRTKAYQQFGDLVRSYKWRRKNNAPYDGRRHSAHLSFEDVPGYLPDETTN